MAASSSFLLMVVPHVYDCFTVSWFFTWTIIHVALIDPRATTLYVQFRVTEMHLYLLMLNQIITHIIWISHFVEENVLLFNIHTTSDDIISSHELTPDYVNAGIYAHTQKIKHYLLSASLNDTFLKSNNGNELIFRPAQDTTGPEY